jgi:hypothetical protein
MPDEAVSVSWVGSGAFGEISYAGCFRGGEGVCEFESCDGVEACEACWLPMW